MSYADVTVHVSTRERYHTTLPLALNSIIMQTVRPRELLIFDDNPQRPDLFRDPLYAQLFYMLDFRRIAWKLIAGQGKGQVHNHQKALEMAQTEWLWRIDDDNVAEPNVLEVLLSQTAASDVGGVAGLVLTPNLPPSKEADCSGRIQDVLTKRNLQWVPTLSGVREVEHLHSTFLYRRKAGLFHGYSLDCSPLCVGEEAIFTYGIKRSGYRLIIDPRAVTWHFWYPKGGIRSYSNDHRADDEALLRRKLAEWAGKNP